MNSYPSGGKYRLSVEDACHLLRASVAQIGRSIGIDFILIKGAAPAFHELCAPRVSSDVDVLMLPKDVDAFVAQLVKRGWKERPWSDPDSMFPQHSITYYHPLWPIDVDVHYRFPGLESDSETVLSQLLAETVSVTEAAVPVPITGLLGTALIAVSHCLRRPHEDRSQVELASLRESLPRLVDPEQLIRMARETGALAATGPFLQEVYPEVAPQSWPTASRDWLLYSTYKSSASIRMDWVLRAPWKEKPALLWHAIWPTRTALGARDIRAMEATTMELLKMRVNRLSEAAVSVLDIINDAVVRPRGRYRRSREAGSPPDHKSEQHGRTE